MSFDADLLDDEELILLRDDGRLLWSIAGAGAQVRRTVETAGEFDLDRLTGDDLPRALLLVGDPACSGALRLMARLLAPVTPAIVWSGVDLPKWAGPADALLAASVDGRHPRIAGIVSQAGRRGLVSCIVAPADSPVAELAGRSPMVALADGVHPRCALWAVTTPFLLAADALGVFPLVNGQLAELADSLDLTAETCRPGSDPFTNPAKAMAIEFADAVPVLAGAGMLPGVSARLFADALRLFAGWPAVSMTLPDGLATAVAMLPGDGSSASDDFFRDRTEDSGARPARVVVIGDDVDPDDQALGQRSAAQMQLDEVAARRSAFALHELASRAGARSSTVDVPPGAPLSRFAAATAFGMFTATYLALGLGIDPSAPRPGEQL